MDLETKASRIAEKLWSDHPATIRVKETRRGVAHANGNVTIPAWTMRGDKPGYAIYYVAHELAHIKASGWHHGPLFMRAFKELCPKSYWHYEKGYKPRNAKAAGI